MKKVFIIISVIITIISFVSIVLSDTFLKTNKTKFPVKTPFKDRKWLNSINYSNEYITSHDKKILHGMSVKSLTDDWVILVHGYDSEARNMACYAEKFYNMGFSVLLPDQRGFGLSEGNETTMGVKEQHDLIKWIEFLNNNKASKIILFGVSMGAATVMFATGNKLPENVRLVIEDCGYTSVYDEFKYNLKRLFGLPEKPFLNIAELYIRFRYGWNIRKCKSCNDAVRKSEIPILFIHGSVDTFVPFYMHDELYSNAKCTKEKLVIYGAGHAESHIVNSELYWSSIEVFIKKHI